jgi:ABC-type transport system involved in multi-copper enzyme maturation permease subunit
LRRISIVFHRDFKELRQSSAFLIISIIFAIITVAASAIIAVVLTKQEFLTTVKAKPVFELIIGLIGYFLPLSVLMTFIWSFTNLTIIKDKVNGNIESLLATPLSAKEIWIGKSTAIFLPGYIISFISTIIILLILNFFVIFPVVGNLILPVPLLLTSFFINPLFFLALLLFIVLFSLAGNPDIAIAPSFIVGFGLMLGIPLGVALGKINLVSWSFTLWSLGAAIIFLAADFSLYRLLIKESIVLSSKG